MSTSCIKSKSVKNQKVKDELWRTFQNNIQTLTKTIPLSLSELAKELDMNYQTLYSITNRNNPNPTMETLIKISNYFGVGIDDLVSENLTKNTHRKNVYVPLFRDYDLVEGTDFIQDNQSIVFCDLTGKVEDIQRKICIMITEFSSHLFPKDTILILDKSIERNGSYLVIEKSNSTYCVIKKHEICHDTYDIIGVIISTVFDW
jgi:DNA-binding XRE family transcriptional regulator